MNREDIIRILDKHRFSRMATEDIADMLMAEDDEETEETEEIFMLESTRFTAVTCMGDFVMNLN